jgi:hypothetical protein
MCEFLSWIELPNGELKYLTNFELNTRDGQRLIKSLGSDFCTEIVGHGAIKEYFGLKNHAGVDQECIDFSYLDNFPEEIVQKIKKGEFSQLGLGWELLADTAWAEYRKVTGPAWAEYEKVTDTAWAEYRKVTGPAWAEYEKNKLNAFWTLFADPQKRAEEWR